MTPSGLRTHRVGLHCCARLDIDPTRRAGTDHHRGRRHHLPARRRRHRRAGHHLRRGARTTPNNIPDPQAPARLSSCAAADGEARDDHQPGRHPLPGRSCSGSCSSSSTGCGATPSRSPTPPPPKPSTPPRRRRAPPTTARRPHVGFLASRQPRRRQPLPSTVTPDVVVVERPGRRAAARPRLLVVRHRPCRRPPSSGSSPSPSDESRVDDERGRSRSRSRSSRLRWSRCCCSSSSPAACRRPRPRSAGPRRRPHAPRRCASTPDAATVAAQETAAANLADSGVRVPRPHDDGRHDELRAGGTVAVTVRCTATWATSPCSASPARAPSTARSVEVVDRYRGGES